jgi:hypothetical protein
VPKRAPQRSGALAPEVRKVSSIRVSRWVTIGAFIGALFAVLAITDVRHFLPYSWGISDRVDFYLCRWMILGFMPWPFPIALFYLLVIVLNACTYSLIFFALGVIVRGVINTKHAGTPKIRGEQ